MARERKSGEMHAIRAGLTRTVLGATLILQDGFTLRSLILDGKDVI